MPTDHPARPPAGPILALMIALAAGCGSPSGAGRPAPPPDGPHGGVAVALPEGAGFGEVVIEPATGSKRGQALVAAYFYGPDLAAPIASPPKSAEVRLALPGGESARVALENSPRPGAAGPPRFASKPGPYQIDSISGELTVDLGGRSSTIPFAGGR